VAEILESTTFADLVTHRPSGNAASRK
jgi:hypothetical protein